MCMLLVYIVWSGCLMCLLCRVFMEGDVIEALHSEDAYYEHPYDVPGDKLDEHDFNVEYGNGGFDER